MNGLATSCSHVPKRALQLNFQWVFECECKEVVAQKRVNMWPSHPPPPTPPFPAPLHNVTWGYISGGREGERKGERGRRH
jgi:hypothetical protein